MPARYAGRFKTSFGKAASGDAHHPQGRPGPNNARIFMYELTLIREKSTDCGTFGVLHGLAKPLQTLELPWRNNLENLSCIPCGRYVCRLRHSPRFRRKLYEVTGVPGRSRVLFHSGNWAGNIEKGKRSDVEGCILLGLARGILRAQTAVLESRPALLFFMQSLDGEDFNLTIRGK